LKPPSVIVEASQWGDMDTVPEKAYIVSAVDYKGRENPSGNPVSLSKKKARKTGGKKSKLTISNTDWMTRGSRGERKKKQEYMSKKPRTEVSEAAKRKKQPALGRGKNGAYGGTTERKKRARKKKNGGRSKGIGAQKKGAKGTEKYREFWGAGGQRGKGHRKKGNS